MTLKWRLLARSCWNLSLQIGLCIYVQFTGEFDDLLPIGFTWADSDHGAETVFPSPLTEIHVTTPPERFDSHVTLEVIFEWISTNWKAAGGANSKIPFLIYEHSSMDTFSALTLEEYN